MEHGSFKDNSHATFTLGEEDHTLANAVRFVLNQDPRVTVGAYTIPHPSLESVNIRVQTTGDPAKEVFKDACQELMQMNRHVRSVFDKAVTEYKAEQERKEKKAAEELQRQRELFGSMDIESN
ncbi:PREDICTED: DNA-directed RNA polymerases I and III subunit RPAC2-like [Camelina sativa]|uniref:DNA-directed RNA polymerases I and III subunit RPAC2-like n=1 Tax=Camelina sativa TaxID=90675 RepID=A0ABM0Z4X0_CAMSA|nr:PREDICTED: DNA-directed RNA polymerases I and III subunit RPAC2-like [Camelina sativa]